MEVQHIAVTGTPGVGKTTFCAEAEAAGWGVQSVTELAEGSGMLGALDAEDGAAPVDIEGLAAQLAAAPIRLSVEGDVGVIDGHLSHHLPVTAIAVLRCHPDVLRERLKARGYPRAKVEENFEAELIGLIDAEARESGLPIFEIDMTAGGAHGRFAALAAWRAEGFKPRRPSAPIDWIEILHGGE